MIHLARRSRGTGRRTAAGLAEIAEHPRDATLDSARTASSRGAAADRAFGGARGWRPRRRRRPRARDRRGWSPRHRAPSRRPRVRGAPARPERRRAGMSAVVARGVEGGSFGRRAGARPPIPPSQATLHGGEPAPHARGPRCLRRPRSAHNLPHGAVQPRNRRRADFWKLSLPKRAGFGADSPFDLRSANALINA